MLKQKISTIIMKKLIGVRMIILDEKLQIIIFKRQPVFYYQKKKDNYKNNA